MTCFVKLSRLFRGLFLHALEKAFPAGRLRFFSGLLPLQERAAFLRHLAPARKSEWVVFAKRPFAGRSRYSPTSAATLIASPSPIADYSPSTTAGSASAGKTTAAAIRTAR